MLEKFSSLKSYIVTHISKLTNSLIKRDTAPIGKKKIFLFARIFSEQITVERAILSNELFELR